MTEAEKAHIFQQMLEEFLSKSPSEMQMIDNDPRYDGGLFSNLQEINDFIEESETYQEICRQETLCALTDETVIAADFRARTLAAHPTYSPCSSFSVYELRIGDGGQKWAAVA